MFEDNSQLSCGNVIGCHPAIEELHVMLVIHAMDWMFYWKSIPHG